MSTTRGTRFWIVTLAAAAGITATTSLGFWQLDRGRKKLALQVAIDRQRALPPVTAQALLAGDPATLVHRATTLRGTWDARHTVYLDNRQMDAKPGFYVVTPLRIEGSDRAVVVERGWVQRNFTDRAQLPPVETPAGVVEVRGRVAPPPSRLYEFRGAEAGPIRQNLDLAAFASETGLQLLPVAVVQEGPPSEGLLRDWPRPATGVERHWGYMAQWWALAVLIAILYAWFQFIVPRRSDPHAR